MTSLVKFEQDGEPRWAVRRHGAFYSLTVQLHELLAMPLSDARVLYEGVDQEISVSEPRLLAPVDEQEIWASGVTYQRSREGRTEESDHADLYTLVYDAERPELFFKTTPGRVVANRDAVGIRKDSSWDVPEAELALVVNSSAEVFGYLIGNDMSSRSIEGDNPLYLPQAKFYTRSCALSSEIVPAWEVAEPTFPIATLIERDGEKVYEADTSTATMRRNFPELVDWLFRSLEFPVGVVLLTGTGLVPDRGFTLHEGDVITISIGGLGTLSNPVTVVGR